MCCVGEKIQSIPENKVMKLVFLACWSNGNAYVSETGGQRFKF